jgi:hypothetical protein
MYYPPLKERFQRVLRLSQRGSPPSTGLKTVLLSGLLALIGLLGALANRSSTLAHLRVAILSSNERGNYYAVVSALAAEARQQQGHIDHLSSAGSVENISRLIAAKMACNIHFAFVQEGMDWPSGHLLELIGRLSKAESFVFLGPDADRIRVLTDLHGKRIEIGPSGSGTARLVRQVFALPHSRGACPARGHYRPARDAVRPVPPSFAVDTRPNGPGIRLPLLGSAHRRPAICATGLPRPSGSLNVPL